MTSYTNMPKFIRSFETYISGDEESCTITGLATDNLGTMYIADPCNKRVKVYDKYGAFQMFFAISGVNRIKQPHDVHVLPRMRLAVSDGGDRSVKIYDIQTGKLLTMVSKFHDPQGITVNSRGQLIVVDSATKCIHTFSTENIKIRTIQRTGETWSLCTPKYVAAGEQDEIIVTDTHGHGVQIFDHVGAPLYKLCQEADQTSLFHPTGVCVDPIGRIMVADEDHHQIVQVNTDNSKDSFLNQGLDYPRAVSFTNTDTLIVAEYYGTVKMYAI